MRRISLDARVWAYVVWCFCFICVVKDCHAIFFATVVENNCHTFELATGKPLAALYAIGIASHRKAQRFARNSPLDVSPKLKVKECSRTILWESYSPKSVLVSHAH